ncbi:cytochrome P450 [Pseudonocardiaceae bacterium YIM PH 21723]|nr:cytochrome P450 [Pseudonocardiaceae bacterium YIM PH 21723]
MSAPVAPGRWPLLGHTFAMARQRADFTTRLRQHGEVVQVYLGPLRTYYIASPELTHQLLVAHGPKLRKGRIFDKVRPFLGNGLAMVSGPEHLRQRRLLQPAFHRDRIAQYATIMADAAAELIDSWTPGETRRIEADMQALAATVVSRSLFSTEISRDDIERLRQDLFLILDQTMSRSLIPGFLSWLRASANRRFDAALARVHAFVMGFIADWRRHGEDRGDQLSALLLAEDEDTGQRMSDQQVYDEVVTLLTAGMETTARALAWLFHELAEHPDIEAKVHAEVTEVLGDEKPAIEHVVRLNYTRQVVKETLRKYTTWILMRHTLQDIELGGYTIPAGSEVIFSPYSLHHDPETFADPERFDPGRWEPDRMKALPKGAFMTFGAGARQCIGNVFAETEIVIVLATIAARHRLVPAGPVTSAFASAPYPTSLPMTVQPR